MGTQHVLKEMKNLCFIAKLIKNELKTNFVLEDTSS